ncbi:MAG: T9SS type A sorting domain-containing protein, partial [Flavisolibacter sp.]|nr:T9SS type A sorting domain-containing protein [Flavisolibacter sp.]
EGPQDGIYGGGGKIVVVDDETGEVYIIPVLHAFDPNDIIGPTGYGEQKWISPNLTLDYTIRFENDPDFATGPAMIVRINHPLDSNVNINSLRLSDFGFGQFNFKVPPNSTFYQQTLDVTDSLGVQVSVTAGIDVTKREAFWIFESLDPATGLPPENALRGFLPVNDTTINRFNDTIPKKGEGFVSFSIQARRNITQLDSIKAQAFIVFDNNAPIETNVWANNLDPAPPVSRVRKIENTGNYVYRIQTTAEDGPGSGVAGCDLYYSRNGGPLLLLAPNIEANSTYVFDKGIKDSTYCFVTIARDHAGNTEAFKSLGESCVTVSDQPIPIIVDFAPKTGPANTQVMLRGRHFTGASKVYFKEGTATFTVLNDSTIRTRAPQNGATGLIRVTAPGGTVVSDSVYTYSNDPGPGSPSLATTISAYPNPTSGQITFSTTKAAFPGGMLYIRDMLGKTVKAIDLSKVHSPELVLDISYVQAGLYFIYLESSQERWVQRIMKR